VRCFYNHHQRFAFKPLVCLSAASNINKTHGGRYGNIERCKSKYPSQESTHITLTLLAPSSDPGSPFLWFLSFGEAKERNSPTAKCSDKTASRRLKNYPFSRTLNPVVDQAVDNHNTPALRWL